MAQTIIDISTPNDGLGDPLRVAMDLQNGMNTELYNTKVDKVLGKELSSNDYTSTEKTKLAGIEAGAQVNVPADWNTLLNKPAELNNSVGYFYYDNTITALSFLAGVEKKLTNNKLGTETDVTHPPYGVTSLWDSTTNALDFTQLNVGDSVDLRLDHETTTTINNQEVKLFVRVGIGSANPKDIVFNHSFAKTSGAQGSESSYVSFPIITEDVRDYPAELYVKSVDDGTILVGGFFIRAIRSGLNIIDVIVETDAPIDGVLYGRKNATWEAVPAGATLGLIKIVDKAGDFFTDLTTASAYIRTFTSATITDESFSNGTFWFTVPNGSSFGLADFFLGNNITAKSAYIIDELGLISTFSISAFKSNTGNNILGNCTFGHSAFRDSTGNNILGNCTFGGSEFTGAQGNNTLGNCTFGDYAFNLSKGDNILGNCIFGIYSFPSSEGNNALGNCTFGNNAFQSVKGIAKIKDITLSSTSNQFAQNSSGRFEIYGNIGATEGANYVNFFTTSTAVIWAQKAKETSNAGGIEGDLLTAQTNGAKLFFGYATAGGGSGTLDGLTDVAIATPLNNQILTYETSSLLWKNKTQTTADIADSVDKRYQTDNQQTYNDATSSIQTQLNAKSNALITTNRQTASYTLVLTDADKIVEMNVATANNLTVPLNSSVAFPIGTKIDVTQYGAGQVTFVATVGVTIRSANSWLKMNARYGAATLTKIATDEWYIWGNLNA